MSARIIDFHERLAGVIEYDFYQFSVNIENVLLACVQTSTDVC